MVGQGAGPSRRSHTKSRKGCKTCKRRHIRCDETFPQCRNCTKHQVRCDYMENIGSETESQHSPEQTVVAVTPGAEGKIEQWQQTDDFPYPNLRVYPTPPTHEYSRNELRLMHHLSSISNDLLVNGSTGLTVWTQKMPKLLSLASSQPFVMHALLSFSANHLAWLHQSTDARNLHIYHGSIALRGLHEAIGNFSQTNADAVLAASLLMLWQATDWRSWSSLRAGIQSVLNTMSSWGHEPLFAELVAEEDLVASSFRSHRRRPSVNPNDRNAILQRASQALHIVQMALGGHESELHWIRQLLGYLQRLQGMGSAQSAEEQFGQLYYLRKWIFWVPISLLRHREGQGPAMLALAHLYATALAVEPLFPDLGSSFCSALVLSPLEAIIDITNTMQAEQMTTPALMHIASLMQFPQQTALNYRAIALQSQQSMFTPSSGPGMIPTEALGMASIGNLSPAFAPPALYSPATQSSSATQSPFLEVPVSQVAQQGFGYGTQGWGIPSPGFQVYGYQDQDDQSSGYIGSSFRGGFVPTPVWT